VSSGILGLASFTPTMCAKMSWLLNLAASTWPGETLSDQDPLISMVAAVGCQSLTTAKRD